MTVMLLIAVCFVASCSQWDPPYEDLNENGYKVSVRFDANGGMFAETPDVYVIDVFNLDDAKTNAQGKKEISLLAPNDALRGTGAFEVSKTKSTFVGWYKEKKLRVDDNGRALDAYGELTSVSGREQAYEYSGRWDFESSVLELDPNKEYKSEENVLTLYAAWVPSFTFDIFVENSEGGFDLSSSIEALDITLPSWNAKTGKMDYKSLKSIEGKTFLEASLTEDFKETVTGTVYGDIDYETGTMSGDGRISVYTKWLDGRWFNITQASQIKENSYLDGCYIINNDLDFTGIIWSSTMASESFTGKIIGNGHKISNIKVNQSSTGVIRGGLFGGLDASCEIKDVTFENITYNMNTGTLKAGSSFGLLAGTISPDAALENVTISGTFNISSKIYERDDYSIGKLSGNVVETGIDISNIQCNVKDDTEALSIEINEANGQITLVFANKEQSK